MSRVLCAVVRCVVTMVAVAAVAGEADGQTGPQHVTSKTPPPNLDSAPGFEGMRERWASAMDEFDVPGMAVAIVKDGRILAIETFGMRAPDDSGGGDGPQPTPDTIYYIASITKTYLATAICTLADDGKLSLDDPVKKHLPRFAVKNGPGGNEATITIRDLLCHKPGLVEGGPIVVLDAYTGEISEDRYYRWLASVKADGVEYSNIHFTLLGRVVEAASGRPWRDYLDERVLKPAGLTRTTGYASRMYEDPDCALPMERVDDQWRVCRLRKTDRTMHAAGGMGASARDAARWLILHMNDGEIDGTRVISAQRAREMRKIQAELPEAQGSIRIMKGFGLGWMVGTFHDTALCSHGGGYAGTATYYAMLPEKKCGFALLMNAGETAKGLQDVIAVDILDRLIDGDERIDVLAAYQDGLDKRKQRRASMLAKRNEEMSAAPKLTRPIAAYTGTFRSNDLGTLSVRPESARLRVTMGECELDVAPAGTDAFKILGPVLEGVMCRFEVAPQGDVTAINLNLDQGAVSFARAADGTLTIDKTNFPHYPGVLVSLDHAKIVSLPKDPADLKSVDADLWIEPRDPEIAAMTAAVAKKLGIKHAGRDAQVARIAADYATIETVPPDCKWIDRFDVDAIAAGAVFLVRSSGNLVYKVRIDAWEKERDGGSMQLTFAGIAER